MAPAAVPEAVTAAEIGPVSTGTRRSPPSKTRSSSTGRTTTTTTSPTTSTSARVFTRTSTEATSTGVAARGGVAERAPAATSTSAPSSGGAAAGEGPDPRDRKAGRRSSFLWTDLMVFKTEGSGGSGEAVIGVSLRRPHHLRHRWPWLGSGSILGRFLAGLARCRAKKGTTILVTRAFRDKEVASRTRVFRGKGVELESEEALMVVRALAVGGGGGGGGVVGTTLFVGELHWWTTDADLEAEPCKYGQVKEVMFFDETSSGKSNGYARVEFYDPMAAATCKEGMNACGPGDILEASHLVASLSCLSE